MTISAQVQAYLDNQPEAKRQDLQALHRLCIELLPNGRLWFLDGRDETGKVVSNPSIGYGSRTIRYADGRTKTFYQIGLSANTAGISVYILGIEDSTYLAQTYGKTLGKASVTGYCIKFKKLGDISLDLLKAAVRDGVERTNPSPRPSAKVGP